MTSEEDPDAWTTDDLYCRFRRSSYATPEGTCPYCGSRGFTRSRSLVDEWRDSRHLEFTVAWCLNDDCGRGYFRQVEDVQCRDVI